jgi:hypothetical protein
MGAAPTGRAWPGRFLRGLLILAAFAGLCGCITGRVDPGALRRFPVDALAGAARDGRVPGLDSSASLDGGLPDFYLFMDRKPAPALFAGLSKALMANQGSGGPGAVAGVDAALLDRINQVLVFRPAGGSGGLLGLVVGDLPGWSLDLGLSAQSAWARDGSVSLAGARVQTWSGALDGNPLHLAMVRDGVLALSVGRVDQAGFQSHLERTAGFLGTGLGAAAGGPDARAGDASARAGEPASRADFADYLRAVQDSPALAVLFGQALPGNPLVSAVRCRLSAAGGQKGRVEAEILLRPVEGLSVKTLRTSLRLGLAGLASQAGVEEGFLSGIRMDEAKSGLVLSGLVLGEDQAAAIIGDLLKMLGDRK